MLLSSTEIIRLAELTPYEMDAAREQVGRGVDLLDEYHLGRDWVRRIDWPLLDMSGHMSCVLGQLFGSFSTGVSALGLRYNDWVNYGFESDHEYDGVTYSALYAAWLEVRDDAVG